VIEAALSNAEEAHNPHLEAVKGLIRKKNVIKAEIEGMQELRAKLSRISERVKFWVKGFKEVQLYIIDEVLQELELVSNSMLTEMGLEDWSLKYAVEKETQAGTVQRGLNVTVLSPDNDKAVRWECWSGGEGQRLRVVGALALSEVLLNHAGVTPNIEILDEPTRGLSDEGVNDLCEYLATRAEQLNKQCWLIDHAAIPSSHFTSTLTVLRDKKGSRLVPTS
jgi:DNA repair exonuclease SbcCD ATPase subunit